MTIGIITAEWPAPAGIVAGATTRGGGVSAGSYRSLNLGGHVGDDSVAVAENRRRFVDAAGLPGEPAWLTQVHGDRVIDADEGGSREADGVVSADGRAVLGILTADCLPILICSTRTPEIAALHCGWRSLAAGIVGNAVSRLAAPAPSLLAWLGPAISPPAFEVGEEVRAAFLATLDGAANAFERNERGRWQADLPALARLSLAAAGVTAIYGGGWCTHGDEARFFSYRRDGTTGRMASYITRIDPA